jgi:hypothetical protein
MYLKIGNAYSALLLDLPSKSEGGNLVHSFNVIAL